MATKFDEIRNPPTRAKWTSDLLALAKGLGFLVSNWSTFSEQRALFEMAAEGFTRLGDTLNYLSRQSFNKTATGEGLTLFSDSHYDNQRVDATKAEGNIRLTLAANEGPYDIGAGDMRITDGTYVFSNMYGFSLSAETSPLTVVFEAEDTGPQYNTPSGATWSLLTTFAGVTATNPSIAGTSSWLLSLGSDEESDDRLRERNATKWSTFGSSEVIADRVKQIALTADPDITGVLVDDSNPRGPGTLDIIVSGLLTTASPDMVDAAQANIRQAFFGPVDRIVVYPAVERPLIVVGTIYYSPSFTKEQVQEQIEDALDKFIEGTPVGGYDFSPGPAHIVRLNDIIKVIEGTEPYVRAVELSSPSSNLSMGVKDKLTKATNSYSGIVYTRTNS